MEEPLELLALPDELLMAIMSALPPLALLRFHSVCSRLTAIPVDSLWRTFCIEKWQRWPQYALSVERELWLHANVRGTWKDRYRFFEADMARTTLTEDELSSIEWWFNFKSAAGGLGELTLREARFRKGLLLLAGYAPLPFVLEQPRGAWAAPASQATFDAFRKDSAAYLTVVEEPQRLLIADFPPHYVTRLLENGEWILSNENVVFSSTLEYREHGFRDVTPSMYT
ncbi:hypothetical protein AB1Y20_019290 [Prymnesium parvum]|uniref:F-box domain-containing protein n=1 Tax=Prymnesium parvum TaxID=97485 RepID=A0AB34JUJ5_PRYPA